MLECTRLLKNQAAYSIVCSLQTDTNSTRLIQEYGSLYDKPGDIQQKCDDNKHQNGPHVSPIEVASEENTFNGDIDQNVHEMVSGLHAEKLEQDHDGSEDEDHFEGGALLPR